MHTGKETQTHTHTLAQIQQQSIYIYTKCTNLVIVRLTQWYKEAYWQGEGKLEGEGGSGESA